MAEFGEGFERGVFNRHRVDLAQNGWCENPKLGRVTALYKEASDGVYVASAA